MKKITVRASKRYDILICRGILSECGAMTQNFRKGCKVLIVCDSNVDPLYSHTVLNSYEGAGFEAEKYVFPAGENSKSMAVLTDLLEYMAKHRYCRSDIVVALGGGVTGDLAGFAAGVYARGIDFIQIPTTLLAAVDSSVGGKTAVDLENGKNMAGVFWQPLFVLCDPATFDTLPPTVFNDGMAEVIKYGVILDRRLFDMLTDGRVKDKIEDIVFRCCALKSEIVKKDEFDTGLRKLLNFGHTIGHAVEKCSKYTVSHGGAVAVGMVAMAKGAYMSGLTKNDCSDIISRVCADFSLPVKTNFSPSQLCEYALSDKKRNGAEIDIVIPLEIGKSSIQTVTTEKLSEILERGV